ncbi:hypothetical protein VPH35_001775 [Triticum aestivum]
MPGDRRGHRLSLSPPFGSPPDQPPPQVPFAGAPQSRDIASSASSGRTKRSASLPHAMDLRRHSSSRPALFWTGFSLSAIRNKLPFRRSPPPRRSSYRVAPPSLTLVCIASAPGAASSVSFERAKTSPALTSPGPGLSSIWSRLDLESPRSGVAHPPPDPPN